MWNGICPLMLPSTPRLRRRRCVCRLRTSRARIARLRLSRSRSLRVTEVVRTRDFLEWPFFTPGHRELAARVDAWAFERFARGGVHAEDRASVDAACRELVRDLGRGGWTRYSVPSEAMLAADGADSRARMGSAANSGAAGGGGAVGDAGARTAGAGKANYEVSGRSGAAATDGANAASINVRAMA